MRFAPALLTLALSATASLAHAGITDIVGFQGVRVWEVTYSTEAADFAAGDPRLVNTLPGAALNPAIGQYGHQHFGRCVAEQEVRPAVAVHLIDVDAAV